MNIISLCQQWGLTRPQLCLILGVTRQYLQHYLSDGGTLPTYVTTHIETLQGLPDDMRRQVIEAKLAQHAPAAST